MRVNNDNEINKRLTAFTVTSFCCEKKEKRKDFWKRNTKQTKNNETNEKVKDFPFVSLFFVCFVFLFFLRRPQPDL